MLTGVRRSGAALAALLILGVVSPGIAAAEPPVGCAKTNPRTGVCLLWVSAPGGGADTGAGTVRPVDRPQQSDAVGPPEPCTYKVADPQPAPSSVVWEGHTPADGVMYVKSCYIADASRYQTVYVFVPNGAAAPGPPVNPRVLAEQAIAAMVMYAPPIRMAPPPGSNSAVVGVPVWLWVDRGEHTTGPTRQSASAGGVTVTAVGQVSQVRWDMGDGTTVTCGAGTPYPPGAEWPSPDCGHVYAQASSRYIPGGGAWPITATSTWTITWSGGELSGTETLALSSSAELFVGEVYVLNQDGGSR
jgi:hypothetical protein